MPFIVFKRERQILEYISQYYQRFGYSPTMSEVAIGIGLNAPSTIHEHVENLVKKGFLTKKPGQARGMEVVSDKFRTAINQGAPELPVLGFIAAGAPLEPHTDPNFYMQVAPSMIAKDKSAYILQVKGTSMIDDGILDGDYVVVQHQQDAKNGDIVVAVLPSGFATLKRIYFETDKVRLEPANSTMTPIYATNVKIQGKVVGVIRKFTA